MSCPEFGETDPFAATQIFDTGTGSGVHRKEALTPPVAPTRPQLPDRQEAWPTDADTVLLLTLQESGLLSDMCDREVLRMTSRAIRKTGDERLASHLDTYYDGAGSATEAARRCRHDRLFVVEHASHETFHGLLARIATLFEEATGARLERLGSPEDSLLVLHLGLECRFIEADQGDEPADPAHPERHLRHALVRAVNELLRGSRRLVPLCMAAGADRYVGLTREGAEVLLAAGIITADALEQASY